MSTSGTCVKGRDGTSSSRDAGARFTRLFGTASFEPVGHQGGFARRSGCREALLTRVVEPQERASPNDLTDRASGLRE